MFLYVTCSVFGSKRLVQMKGSHCKFVNITDIENRYSFPYLYTRKLEKRDKA